MDEKDWEKWADRIDEARKREATGDLSNIAYQILNSITITKVVSMKRKDLICDHVTKDCPEKCIHRTPHQAHLDHYIEGKTCTYCDKEPSTCGWKIDTPLCTCK